MEQKAEIGIVVGSMLRHQIEYFVGQPVPVLDGGATGKNGGPGSFGTLSMNDGSFAKRPCLTAGGINLCLRQCRSAAFADAFGRENFDQVCSLCHNLADECANLFGSTCGVIYRAQ